MATDVAVVIAYRDLGCPHRRASFEYVHGYYTDLGYPVVVEAGDETFTRASAINAAVRQTDATVIIQSDPDSFVPWPQLDAAVALASVVDGPVSPFTRWLYLNPDATTRLIDGFSTADVGPEDCDEHGERGVGNVMVFSRRTWEVCGGFDERFGMWGGDDVAFAHSAAAFTRPLRRVTGDMWHLWHPRHPDSDPTSRAYVDQFVLVAEYRDAAALGPEAVRDYVRQR